VLWETGKPREAEAELRAAIAFHEKAAKENPAVVRIHRSLALSRDHLGRLLAATGKPEAAEAEYRAALAISQTLADENPDVPDLRSITADIRSTLGRLLLQMGRPVEAEAECRKAQAINQKIADDNPAVLFYRHWLVASLNNLGDVVRSAGRAAEAKSLYESAIARSEPGVRDGSADPEQRFGLVCSMWRRGQTLRDLGDAAGAAADVRRSLELSDGLPPLSGHEFEAACGHAALAGLAARPGSGVTPAEGEGEAARAMEWLGRAVAMGYGNVNELRIESALDSLRSREDFKKLMKQLEEKAAKGQEVGPFPQPK
jgi:serine/threonine-protein kinase